MEDGRAVGDRGCCLPCSGSALVLLWPGLEKPGPSGLWPEGEGCTLRAHPCEHLQAGYISPKLSGWSHSLEPFLPKSASMDHPLWGEKRDCSSQLPPRPTSCLCIHCQGQACPRSDGCVTHWSQRRVCGSLASLLCSLVKVQTLSPCRRDSHGAFLLLQLIPPLWAAAIQCTIYGTCYTRQQPCEG